MQLPKRNLKMHDGELHLCFGCFIVYVFGLAQQLQLACAVMFVACKVLKLYGLMLAAVFDHRSSQAV